MSEPTAPVIEVFSSLQGEGLRVGERHLFVRFQDCPFSCAYCDTPAGFVAHPQARIETVPFSKKFIYEDNPLSVTRLLEILESFDHGEKCLSMTGGEPLQQADFLADFLSRWNHRRPVLLETAGIHFRELERIIDGVDIIAMDIKLPSATGMRPYWKEHRQFLQIARRKECYAKIIFTEETSEEDIKQAVALLDDDIPLVFQPASAFAQFRAVPAPATIARVSAIAKARHSHVVVIPQQHKTWRVL